MSEFRDVCKKLRLLYKTYELCSQCQLHEYKFCRVSPEELRNGDIDAAERCVVDIKKDLPTIGQFLEEQGYIGKYCSDKAKVQSLYQTKVPLEWLK